MRQKPKGIIIVSIIFTFLFCTLIYAAFVRPWLIRKNQENPQFGFYLIFGILVWFNYTYCFAKVGLHWCMTFLNDRKTFFCLLIPVASSIRLRNIYHTCIQGKPVIWGDLQLITSILATGGTIAGLIFLQVKYGFLFIFKPHLMVLCITLALFYLHTLVKSFAVLRFYFITPEDYYFNCLKATVITMLPILIVVANMTLFTIIYLIWHITIIPLAIMRLCMVLSILLTPQLVRHYSTICTRCLLYN